MKGEGQKALFLWGRGFGSEDVRTKSVEREGFSFVFVKYQHRNLLVSRKRYLFMTVFLRNEHEGYQVTCGTPKRERK